jgi:hypothetical protein
METDKDIGVWQANKRVSVGIVLAAKVHLPTPFFCKTKDASDL